MYILAPFPYERKHPLASWLATIMICFSGGILSCLLFGKPLAVLLVNPEKIALASLLWYIVNYVPGVFSLLTTRPVLSIILALKEVHRLYNVHNGVKEAQSLHPYQPLILFTNGFLKGSHTLYIQSIILHYYITISIYYYITISTYYYITIILYYYEFRCCGRSADVLRSTLCRNSLRYYI